MFDNPGPTRVRSLINLRDKSMVTSEFHSNRAAVFVDRRDTTFFVLSIVSHSSRAVWRKAGFFSLAVETEASGMHRNLCGDASR